MKANALIFLFVICIAVSYPVCASTFNYSIGASKYTMSLEGTGVINPSLSFNITGGYIVPYNPQNTYLQYNQTIVFNTQGWESPGGGSISTLYDTNPQILVGNTSVFKTWYQASVAPQAVGYAESTDGITWYKYASNPVITGNYFGGDVIKYNNSYYMFANLATHLDHITRFHSSDGLSWTNDGEVATKSGGWSTSGLLYQDVWMDSAGNWKMLISGLNATNVWGVGLWEASSPDAASWTANVSNPVIQAPPSGYGSGLVYLPSGTYKDPNGYTWTWVSAAENSTSNAANTDSMRFRTVNPNDLTSWTLNPTTYLNVGASHGITDPTDWQGRTPHDYIRVGNITYEFYTYNIAGHPGYNGLLKTPLRIDHIVATNEMYPNLTSQSQGV